MNSTEASAHRRRVKLEALAAYGGRCACCGEDYLPFLSLDHVVGDGAARRAEYKQRGLSGMTAQFAAQLRREGYPPKAQVLCMNCNQAKGTSLACPCRSRDMTVTDALALLPPRAGTKTKTKCIRGHTLPAKNNVGKRVCRPCNNIRAAKHRAELLKDVII